MRVFRLVFIILQGHTFSSLLIDADVSIKVIQELLGHSTITTSMDIYTHISDKKKQQALDRLQEI